MNLLTRIIFFPVFLLGMLLWLIGTLIAGIYGYFRFSSSLKLKIKWFKGFYPEHINGTFEKIAFHEYIWNTGAGKFGSLMGVVNNLGWGTMLLAVFRLDKFFYLVPIAVISYPVMVYVLGYVLHHIKYIYRQGDVMNRLTNPQIVRIEKQVKELMKR